MTGTVATSLPNAFELGEMLEQVWSSFLDGDIVAMPSEDPDRLYPDHMVASVSISGAWSGHLMIITGHQCARAIAGTMFQMDGDEVATAEVADALGEIANMVGGSVKGMVGVAATLSLPQVILDAAALVNPDARKLVSVDAHWQGQQIEVSLWERRTEAVEIVKGA